MPSFRKKVTELSKNTALIQQLSQESSKIEENPGGIDLEALENPKLNDDTSQDNNNPPKDDSDDNSTSGHYNVSENDKNADHKDANEDNSEDISNIEPPDEIEGIHDQIRHSGVSEIRESDGQPVDNDDNDAVNDVLARPPVDNESDAVNDVLAANTENNDADVEAGSNAADTNVDTNDAAAEQADEGAMNDDTSEVIEPFDTVQDQDHGGTDGDVAKTNGVYGAGGETVNEGEDEDALKKNGTTDDDGNKIYVGADDVTEALRTENMEAEDNTSGPSENNPTSTGDVNIVDQPKTLTENGTKANPAPASSIEESDDEEGSDCCVIL